MAIFPTTGVYKTHRGMFIGETHDERETMDVLIQKMRVLATAVDVILLEYYPEGQTPHLKWAEQIAGELTAFNKGFGMPERIGKQVYRLWSMAYYFGVEVYGIEQPTPGGMNPGGPQYLTFRMSNELNQAFLDCVDHYATMKAKPSVRFCMYGGMVHWVKLRKLAPTMTGYRLNPAKNDFVALPFSP
ncbi:MAG: hypothetical protein U0359_29925 [Byssovorax sp.]